jgi:integrase
MAKGSVRKKGKKWYYRFYVEDASGNLVQKEFTGTESKSETEKMLRKAMEDYESKMFLAKADNTTLAKLLDTWAEEELKTGTLSNGTVGNYLGAIRCIKKHPLANRKLKTITSGHLQEYLDLLIFGGEYPDGKVKKGLSINSVRSYSAVLQQSFRFAVFPKQFITFNPMQYVKMKRKAEDVDLFSDDDMEQAETPILSHEDYKRLITYLKEKNPPAVLPIQISYYTGLRIGETCGLTWQDINLEEQYLTVRRSIRYDSAKHKNVIGTTKRKKVRIVDFGDTLTTILKKARKEQLKNKMQYGELYHTNYYKEVQEKNRVYYEYYNLENFAEAPEEYKAISFVCLRPDGCLELPSTLSIVCRSVAKTLDGFEGFHFHQLRHTYTSNLLSNGAAPKDVQELLGHSDVSTTMNVYAHATREAKRNSARLLDKVSGND